MAAQVLIYFWLGYILFQVVVVVAAAREGAHKIHCLLKTQTLLKTLFRD